MKKAILMGSKRDWLIICIIFNAWVWPFVHGSGSYNRFSLDSFLYDYALKKVRSFRAGKLYNVPLAANLSGVQVSILRLRTSSLWKNGANYSSFVIPPGLLPWPFTRRVDIVYQNLGNWSSSYYNVPNYTFVAPVVGFLAYDSNRSSMNYGLVELKLMGGSDPITVQFPNISVSEDGNLSMKCVRFGADGTVELSNATMGSSCVVRRQGHFSVVVPNEQKKDRTWVMGIAAGAVGLVLLVVLGCVAYKWIKEKRIEKMERNSERSEGLETIWIGGSRMPSASGIRTLPVLESSYVP